MQATPEKPAEKEEGSDRARAFEQEYESSHPNGPYPPVEVKPKPSGADEQRGAER